MKSNVVPYAQNFNKVTIITGGSKGIGAGCAKVFAAAGASVVICDLDRLNGEALAANLTDKGPGKCHFEYCDVSEPNKIDQVVNRTIEKYGRLDCLINNAARHPGFRPIDTFSIEDFQELLQLNLISYIAACKSALPYLRQTRGSIINMGSLCGKLGHYWATAYCTTKGAISGFTKALAIEEARSGVRVNTVLPGNIMTQSRIDLEGRMKNGQAFHDSVEKWQWSGRSGTIEEVGHSCLFLASDGASFITGIELILSGGAELGFGIKEPIAQL